jgi:hypothetical protein
MSTNYSAEVKGYLAEISTFVKSEGTSQGQEWEKDYDHQTSNNKFSILKRVVSIRIAKEYKFSNGIEAFAGVGLSTCIYKKCCNVLYASEKDKTRGWALLKNINPAENVKIFLGDNLKMLHALSKDDSGKFDLSTLILWPMLYQQATRHCQDDSA